MESPSLRRERRGMTLLEQQQGNGTTIGGGGAYGGEASFDTNMVIILAALLCALICALGLNSIVRCALRCGRGLAPESADRSSAARGLKKSALRRIPVAAYGPGAAAVGTDCAICLGEFESGERVRVLPLCNHGFHVRCIDPWLASHSSCPTCRRSLLDCQGVAVAVVAGNNSAADQHQVAIGVDES